MAAFRRPCFPIGKAKQGFELCSFALGQRGWASCGLAQYFQTTRLGFRVEFWMQAVEGLGFLRFRCLSRDFSFKYSGSWFCSPKEMLFMRTVRDMPPACTRDCLVGPSDSVESLQACTTKVILQYYTATCRNRRNSVASNTEASAEMNLRLRV